MTRLLFALMLLCSTAGAQVKPAVMARQQAIISLTQTKCSSDLLEAKLQALDYRITGLWVENKRLIGDIIK